MPRLSNPLPIFLDARGALLDSGSVYIGEAGTDPAVESNRLDVFWDAGLTIPAAQPLRTLGGVIVNALAPAFVYLAEEDYSLRIADADGISVLYVASATAAEPQYQPLDAELTALAEQANTAFGRGLLNLSDAADLRERAELGTIAPLDKATFTEYRANTANKALATDQVWAAAAPVALSQSGGTVAIDLATGFNFTLAMTGGPWTLAAPTNAKVGQSGTIEIRQDATGSRALAFADAWKFAGGIDPALSTAGNSLDVLSYRVLADGTIFAGLSKGLA